MLKYIVLFLVSVLFHPFSIATSLPKERQITVQHKILVEGSQYSSVTEGYLIYYPEDYETQADTDFPVVLSLHGNGENGSNIDVLRTKSTFLSGLVENNYNYPFIIVSPLASSSMDSLSKGNYLEQLMEHVRENNRIDTSREYVQGISQGGKGARLYAERNATTIAGLVSSSGYSAGDTDAIAELVKSNVPVILSHNEDDGTIGFNSSNGYYKKFIAAGGSEQIIFDTQPTGGHNSWGRVNKNMAYWEWLFSFRNILSGIEVSEQKFTPASLQVDSTRLQLSLKALDTVGDVKGIASVQVDLSSIGGSTLDMSNVDGSNYYLDYSISNSLDVGVYSVDIIVSDLEGNEETLSTQLEVKESYNEPPTITMISPLSGHYFAEGEEIKIQVDALDYDGQVNKVEFFANGVLIGSDVQAPFELGLNSLKPGEHTISAKATDEIGGSNITAEISINISPSNLPNTSTHIVLPIEGAGKASGSSYFPMDKAFDSQPSFIDANGVPELVDGNSNAPAYSERFGYIDFGADWSKIRIAQTWTLYRASSAGDHTPYVEVWWDNDNDIVNDSQEFEANINFNTAKGLAYSKETSWALDRDMSASPLTPLNRYLLFRAPQSMTSRASEYVFTGYIQEELPPLSLFLTSPLSLDSYKVNESVNLQVEMVNDDNVTHIEYFANDELLLTSSEAPFAESISFSKAGDYQIVARAYESSGTVTDSEAITITIEQTLDVIVPVDAGRADGSSYFPMQFAFDSQPTFSDAGLSDVSGGQRAPYYKGRFGYIDFGENWENVSISKVYTLYRPWSAGAHTPYAELWWDNDKDTVNDGITETQINFNTETNLPYQTYTQWSQDRDFSESPVTAKGRYLMLRAPDVMTARALEYVLIGYQ